MKVGYVMIEHESGAESTAAPENPVGIIVHDSRPEQPRPRAVAFVYGSGENIQPSLPYGRWKRVDNAA